MFSFLVAPYQKIQSLYPLLIE